VVLSNAVKEMAAGLIDADLGGQVFKKRIPLPGRGKRGGARALIGTNLADRWFFLFGFGKNERASVDAQELAALQKIAETLLALDSKKIEQSVQAGELVEVGSEEKPTAT